MQQDTINAMRTERLRRGLTLRALARRCAAEGVPVDFSQLARIERGENTPRPALRATLAKILDLPVTYFDEQKACT